MSRYLRVSVLVGLFLLVGCEPRVTYDFDQSGDTRAPYIYQQPLERGDGWETEVIDNVNVDKYKIAAMTDAIRKGKFGKIEGILLIKDGKLVYETYHNGFEYDDLHDLRSVSKSVVSIITGIAIDHGFVPSVDSKLYELFPEYSPFGAWDARKNDIALKHLLTMSTGLACNDNDGNSPGREQLMFLEEDWLKFFLDLPMDRNPGELSQYCSGSVVAASAMIEKYTSTNSAEFADQYLFSKLGITNYLWGTTPKGHLHPNGLNMNLRDLAKLGQVMLDGTWNGSRIVSQAWVDESSAPHAVDIAGDPVGYLWYQVSVEVDGETVDAFFTYGYGGQSIMVVPSKNAVLAMAASNYSISGFSYATNLITTYVLPAL